MEPELSFAGLAEPSPEPDPVQQLDLPPTQEVQDVQQLNEDGMALAPPGAAAAAGMGCASPEVAASPLQPLAEQPLNQQQQQQQQQQNVAATGKRPAAGAPASDPAAGVAAAAPPGKRSRVRQQQRAQRQQQPRGARTQPPSAGTPEEDGAGDASTADAAAAATGAPPPMALLQEPPVPMQGVECDLPPPPAQLEGRAPDPLTPQALATLAGQHDAAAHDQYLRLLRFDDRLAELASQRGLLVRFHVRAIQAFQAQADMVVEAPEFMTVEYLKRRVARAKLMRGEFLLTARFLLRKRRAQAAAPGGPGMEDLPSSTPAGDEVFLSDLGYRAPGTYQLFIASAPQTTDREQQEGMMQSLLVQQQQQLQARRAAAAANRMAQRPEVQSASLAYQALLQAPAGQQQQAECRAAAAGNLVAHAAQEHAATNLSVGGASHLGSNGEAGPAARRGLADKSQMGRRQMGRWSAEEVAALIEGVHTYGTRWAAVYDAHVTRGRINQRRTQVDLKDKWRNLVRLVTEPGKQARSIDLSEEQRRMIWDAVLYPEGTRGGQARSGGAASEHGSPDLQVRAGNAIPPSGQRQPGSASPATN